MNDFVKIRDFVTGSPDFSKVEEVASYTRGINVWTEYQIKKNHNPIKLRLNESSGEMDIKGNVGFFWNGHNLSFPNSEFIEAIDYLSQLLSIDISKMKLVEFDHSALVKLDQSPQSVIMNHLFIKGHETKPQKAGKYFLKPRVQLVKMYDATRRIKQIYSSTLRKDILLQSGLVDGSNLLRFEKKILNPHAYFKSQLTVDDILKPDFISQLDNDLIDTYKSIMKTGLIKIPEKKKHLTSSTIPLIIGKELGMIYDFDFDALMKERIREIPETILTKDDKKARMRQIKANLKKITSSGLSQFDITVALSNSLKMP